MKKTRWIILIAVAMTALAHRSDGQQPRPLADQLRLAGVMPRGALVYVQAADLSALMKRWMASPVRKAFYASPSFSSFSDSHLWAKLQDRKGDFDKAIGFGLDEDRLAELAGGASAVSIYDIGRLELVFVTEVPRAKAVATTMFKQIPQFQERSAGGAAYYVRDVSTDGGRLNEQFCFAYAGDKVIVATTEGLMIRALANVQNPGGEALLADVLVSAQQAEGFAAHEITLWADQARLNKNRHFNSYWLYHNISESSPDSLADIETGLIDMSMTVAGLNERRWFRLKADHKTTSKTLAADRAAAFTRFAPASTQMVEVHGEADSAGNLGAVVSRTLFGKLPAETPAPPDAASDANSSTGRADDSGRTDRYSRLDARFDVDEDDPQAPKLGSKDRGPAPIRTGHADVVDAEKRFADRISPLLAQTGAAGYCQMTRSSVEAGKPFARFERAVVIEMNSAAALDRAGLERTITGELRDRYVVAGAEPKLEWQDDASVRYVAQALLEQGGAYAISGKYLILASSRELGRDILQSAALPRPADAYKPADAIDSYTLVRIVAAKPVFDKLMGKLDGKIEAAPVPKKAAAKSKNADSSDEEDTTNTEGADKDQDTKKDVKFFSDNISSLVASSMIKEVRVQRQIKGSTLLERVSYSW